MVVFILLFYFLVVAIVMGLLFSFTNNTQCSDIGREKHIVMDTHSVVNKSVQSLRDFSTGSPSREYTMDRPTNQKTSMARTVPVRDYRPTECDGRLDSLARRAGNRNDSILVERVLLTNVCSVISFER